MHSRQVIADGLKVVVGYDKAMLQHHSSCFAAFGWLPNQDVVCPSVLNKESSSKQCGLNTRLNFLWLFVFSGCALVC